MKIGKHQRNIDQSSQRIGSRKDIQEKEQPQDNPKLREQKGNRKGENKDLILKHQLQQMTYQRTNGSEAPITLQGQAESNLSILKTKRRDMHKLLSDNQPNSPNDLAFQQTQMLQNFELQGGKHHAGENGQQSVKEKIQVRRQIGSESRSLPKKHSHTSQATTDNGSSTESTGTVQSVGFPNKKHHGDLAQEKISSNFSVNVQDSMNKNSNQNSSPRNLNTESSSVIKDQKGHEPEFDIDKCRSHSTLSDPLNRTHEGRIDVTYPSQLENQKVSELEMLEPLSESEDHLKQILIKSQLFLNTAEALFKLNIPLDILQACGHACHDEESKLILDCGYEVMKEKAKGKSSVSILS
ncbi:hypothetical protein GH714_015323 [Hevea brasiliensis]|uniref:DUF3741 domain-containing protein n=1 Tax=Hevea brasiliensis TaxID=3981 RepID=A0A6A6NHE0_HEVBR|nr:hypothetical protein GH714_015323 [Hevea brasiliensis]